MLAAAALPEGRILIDQLGDGIRALYGTRRWPDQPTWICAVRLDDGALVVFGREGSAATDIGSAVQASSAIPGFFAPVEIDGARYVDGGAHSPTNLDVVAGLGPDLVVVSSPMSAAGGGPTSLRTALRIPTGLFLARETRLVRRSGTDVLVFQPTEADLTAMGTNAMDFSRRGPVARQAFESARARLAEPRIRERTAAMRDAAGRLARSADRLLVTGRRRWPRRRGARWSGNLVPGTAVVALERGRCGGDGGLHSWCDINGLFGDGPARSAHGPPVAPVGHVERLVDTRCHRRSHLEGSVTERCGRSRRVARGAR